MGSPEPIKLFFPFESDQVYDLWLMHPKMIVTGPAGTGTRPDETEQEQTALVGRGFGLTGCRCFGFLRGLVNRLTVNNVYCRFELQILFLVRRYVGR